MIFRLLGDLSGRIMRLGAVVLVGLAVEQELKKPRNLRTWQGEIGGIPYNFRPPTRERLLAEWWQPGSKRLFTDTAFGLGWGLNFARAAEMVGLKKYMSRARQ